MSQENQSQPTRRSFLISGLVLTATSLCLCSLVGCKKHKANTPVIPSSLVEIKGSRITLDVQKVPALEKVGGSAKVVNEDLKNQILVVHMDVNRYVAMSNRCTHRGGEVEYRSKDKTLICANNCGRSVFRINGEVIRGPAPKPLETYKVLFFEGKLEVFL